MDKTFKTTKEPDLVFHICCIVTEAKDVTKD